MANCSYCDAFVLFGAKTDNTGSYCSRRCQQFGNLLAVSQQIPKAEIDRLVQETRHANCPRCGCPGPLDVYKAYRIWSALVLTSWNSSTALSCRSCAIKRQAGSLAFCTVFGWWGFPWGVVMTPIHIVRNVIELASGTPAVPTPLLEKFVRLRAAASVGQGSRPNGLATPAAPPPLPSRPSALQGDERYMPKPTRV